MGLKRIHYGWVTTILGISSIASFATVVYTFGIFLVPVTTEFSWERGELSAALSITTLVGGLSGHFYGKNKR